MGEVSELLRGQRVIALDTCVWIYHIEEHPDYKAITTAILAAVAKGRCRGIVSELTLMELVVAPFKQSRQDVADEYEALLSHFPHLDLIPISRSILLGAANLRAEHGIRTPDAIILATALQSEASLVIGNDREWVRVLKGDQLRYERIADLSA